MRIHSAPALRWIGVATLLALAAVALHASSHREAPAITLDPTADNTDVYAFVSYEEGREGFVTLISNFIPLETPYGGPNFHKFDPAASYLIHIDNDGDAVEEITYELRFRTEIRDDQTFLTATGPIGSLDDPIFNVRQLYRVTRYEGPPNRGVRRRVLASELIAAPPHIGPSSTPDYPGLAQQAIFDLPGGGQVFAGPRDEGFYLDLGSIFDLLQIGAAPPLDRTAGLNVHSIALEVPISSLTRDGSTPGDPADPAAVIGVWSSARRSTFQLRNSSGGPPVGVGILGFNSSTQVSRLGNPLVNEVVIPLGSKDRFNASHPSADVQFLPFVLDPEPPRLLQALFGVPVPPAPRNDLFAVFLTGVEGLNQPPGVVPSEQLRLNVAIPPTPAGQQSRLGVLGNDLAGFPNGRRVGDDTVDIVLQAAAGILVDGTGAGLGDGVDGNDVPYLDTFPYMGTPHPGRLPAPMGLAFGYDCATCPANWFAIAQEFELCRTGGSQTPINLDTDSATRVAIPPIGTSYPATDIEVEHLGNTVEAIIPPGTAEIVVGSTVYEVVQFHFHTPSEHFRDGEEFPIEMHIVHRSADGELLVIGIFLAEGPPNQALSRIFDDLPQQPGDHVDLEDFELADILPFSLGSYRYTGSLTTPDCREGVEWIVLALEQFVSAEQIAAMQAIFSPENGFPDGNRRPLQPLNGRTLVTDVINP